jgi:hypothetical protein
MVLQQLKFEHMEFGFKYTVNLKSFRIWSITECTFVTHISLINFILIICLKFCFLG